MDFGLVERSDVDVAEEDLDSVDDIVFFLFHLLKHKTATSDQLLFWVQLPQFLIADENS